MAAIDSSKILDQVISTPIHNHCMRIGQMKTHQRRSQFAKSPVVSWSSPWPTCISWLCWLAGEVACILLLYLCTQVFQSIFWLMTHSIASPVTDQWLRFGVPSPLISDGFEVSCWPGWLEWASTVSLALFLNWVMTRFTVDSGMDRFLDISCWLAAPSSWPAILPIWESVSSKEPGNQGMLIHSVVHYSAIYSAL